MGNIISVQVLDRDGNPVKGVEVKIIIDVGIFDGGFVGPDNTDRDGQVEFETEADYDDSRKLCIYVRGQKFGPFEIGGGSYTVTLA